MDNLLFLGKSMLDKDILFVKYCPGATIFDPTAPKDRKNRNFGFDLTLEIDSEIVEQGHAFDFCNRVTFESTLCKHFKEIKKSLDKSDHVV